LLIYYQKHLACQAARRRIQELKPLASFARPPGGERGRGRESRGWSPWLRPCALRAEREGGLASPGGRTGV